MSLTLPQLIMLGHAAHVNYERSGLNKDKDSDDVKVTINGKSKDFSKMTSEDYTKYYSDWGSS